MADGSDAIADWPLLNALVNTASGASWVSIHHGGGVGIGRSIHAGQVSVADGTALAAAKVERVLTNDPGDGRDPARRRRLPGGQARWPTGWRPDIPMEPSASDCTERTAAPTSSGAAHDVRPAACRRQPVRLRLVATSPGSGRDHRGAAIPGTVSTTPTSQLRQWFTEQADPARAGRGERPQRQRLGLVGSAGHGRRA